MTVHTLSLSLRGESCGVDRSSISELLEPEEDTLIWSEWVLLPELSLAVRDLHTWAHFSHEPLIGAKWNHLIYLYSE